MNNRQNPIYHVWCAMRQRCNNPNAQRYVYYGGRGISVCERWNDFNAFTADMGPRPDGYDLDRIDNNGNYEPSNCRWISRSGNLCNRRPFYKKSTHPMRHIIKVPEGYRVTITIKPRRMYNKNCRTLEQAQDLRSEIEFEREMHRRLGLG